LVIKLLIKLAVLAEGRECVCPREQVYKSDSVDQSRLTNTASGNSK